MAVPVRTVTLRAASPSPTKLQRLIAECAARDLRRMVAVIGDAQNAASIGLHLACGFRPEAEVAGIGWKAGQWLGWVLMARELASGAAEREGVSVHVEPASGAAEREGVSVHVEPASSPAAAALRWGAALEGDPAADPPSPSDAVVRVARLDGQPVGYAPGDGSGAFVLPWARGRGIEEQLRRGTSSGSH